MPKLQNRVIELIKQVTGGTIGTETPSWLLHPGQEECGKYWQLVCKTYNALTGLELPDVMPSKETRKIDGILRMRCVGERILEVDEKQHFNRHRIMTIDLYPIQQTYLWLSKEMFGPNNGKANQDLTSEVGRVVNRLSFLKKEAVIYNGHFAMR